MKLSEQLQQDHDCGDFGQALDGYAERAKLLESCCDTYSMRVDLLLEKMQEMAKTAGIISEDAILDGPQGLMICDDIIHALNN